MQASKIQIDGTYAIHRGDGLKRFVVDSVTTVRHRSTGSPHDYKSHITGYVVEECTSGPNVMINIKPDDLLGPYEEQVVLVQRAKAEADEKRRVEDEKKANAMELRHILYTLVGKTPPVDTNYGDLIRARSDISINERMVRPILDALKGKL